MKSLYEWEQSSSFAFGPQWLSSLPTPYLFRELKDVPISALPLEHRSVKRSNTDQNQNVTGQHVWDTSASSDAKNFFASQSLNQNRGGRDHAPSSSHQLGVGRSALDRASPPLLNHNQNYRDLSSPQLVTDIKTTMEKSCDPDLGWKNSTIPIIPLLHHWYQELLQKNIPLTHLSLFTALEFQTGLVSILVQRSNLMGELAQTASHQSMSTKQNTQHPDFEVKSCFSTSSVLTSEPIGVGVTTPTPHLADWGWGGQRLTGQAHPSEPITSSRLRSLKIDKFANLNPHSRRREDQNMNKEIENHQIATTLLLILEYLPTEDLVTSMNAEDTNQSTLLVNPTYYIWRMERSFLWQRPQVFEYNFQDKSTTDLHSFEQQTRTVQIKRVQQCTQIASWQHEGCAEQDKRQEVDPFKKQEQDIESRVRIVSSLIIDAQILAAEPIENNKNKNQKLNSSKNPTTIRLAWIRLQTGKYKQDSSSFRPSSLPPGKKRKRRRSSSPNCAQFGAKKNGPFDLAVDSSFVHEAWHSFLPSEIIVGSIPPRDDLHVLYRAYHVNNEYQRPQITVGHQKVKVGMSLCGPTPPYANPYQKSMVDQYIVSPNPHSSTRNYSVVCPSLQPTVLSAVFHHQFPKDQAIKWQAWCNGTWSPLLQKHLLLESFFPNTADPLFYDKNDNWISNSKSTEPHNCNDETESGDSEISSPALQISYLYQASQLYNLFIDWTARIQQQALQFKTMESSSFKQLWREGNECISFLHLQFPIHLQFLQSTLYHKHFPQSSHTLMWH